MYKLPIGIQDFRKIRENGFKYVDKTRYIYELASAPMSYFLSRPRRFGKSLTVSTLQELYSGSRELFEGLCIADRWDWTRRHPVVRLTLTGIGFPKVGLESALHYALNKVFAAHGIPVVENGSATQKFDYLLNALADRGEKVVVLIDEYDAPIVHYLGEDIDLARRNRDELREFYTVLKNNDHVLELVFLTGVSKFSKVGIFSGLNNLQDITMHPAYATMLGYTQAELEVNFAEEIAQTAKYLKQTEEELLEQLRYWYNGYRFDERAETVYNPVSINNFFSFQKFQNYWFATGTPTFLITV
ncbi:MAG: AAA family ATPase [Saprospiraceae bacterium]|nr:AAA family ATPase [Saprospiraceae bacterium]